MAEYVDRFRSFAERYVIARASHFEVGKEQEQAWLAIQDAKRVYGMIADAKNETDGIVIPEGAQQAGVAGATMAGPPPNYPMSWLPRNGAKAPPTTLLAPPTTPVPWGNQVSQGWFKQAVSQLLTKGR